MKFTIMIRKCMFQNWSINNFPEIRFLNMENAVLALHWKILQDLNCTLKDIAGLELYIQHLSWIVSVYLNINIDTLIYFVDITIVH
jgi:hypothetical protein